MNYDSMKEEKLRRDFSKEYEIENLKKKIDNLLLDYQNLIEDYNYQFKNYLFDEDLNEIIFKFIMMK